MPTPQVQVEFHTYEEPETLAKRLEVKAIDCSTGYPLAALPLPEMGAWLRSSGYRPLIGSAGIWIKEERHGE